MWYLINEKGEKFYLLCKENHVGRLDGDIVLKDDQSISRKHAIIQVQQNLLSQIPKVTLFDAASKYGTFINKDIESNRCVSKKTPHELSNGDQIRFGFQWNKFKLCRDPIKISYSSIEKSLLTELKNNISKFGGVISSKWESDCTYLTMTSITVTAKLIYALACGKPIVNTIFWKDYLNAVLNRTNIPDPKDYEPPLKEPNLNPRHISFSPNSKRSNLLYGKSFVFYTKKQYEALHEMIRYAGGRSLNWGQDNISLAHLKKPDWILIQYLEPSEEYEKMSNELKLLKLRTIPDTELSLAIIYCSVEKYCNPKYSFAGNLRSSSKNNITGIILAPETLENTISTQATFDSFELSVIPETQYKPGTSQKSEITSVPETQSQQDTDVFNDSFELLDESAIETLVTPSVSSEKTGKRKAEEELLKESSIKKTNIEKSGFFFNTPSTVTSKRKAEDELLKESPIKKANNKKLEDKLNSPVAKSYWDNTDSEDDDELVIKLKKMNRKIIKKQKKSEYILSDSEEERRKTTEKEKDKERKKENDIFHMPNFFESDSDKETEKSDERKKENDIFHMPNFFESDSEKETEKSNDIEKEKNTIDNFSKKGQKRELVINSDSDNENSNDKKRKCKNFKVNKKISNNNFRQNKRFLDSEDEAEYERKEFEKKFFARKFEYPTISIKEQTFLKSASKYYIKIPKSVKVIPDNQFLDLSTLTINSVKNEDDSMNEDEEPEFNQSKITIQTIKTYLQIPCNLGSQSFDDNSQNYKLFKKQHLHHHSNDMIKLA